MISAWNIADPDAAVKINANIRGCGTPIHLYFKPTHRVKTMHKRTDLLSEMHYCNCDWPATFNFYKSCF